MATDEAVERAEAAKAAAMISLTGVRDTVPLAPAEVLGTAEHPFGECYRPVTEREIEEIVALTDQAQRNLRITQGYHDLKMSMTFLLGRRNVNWCAFATWASRTAGHFIRGDYMPGLVQAYLDQVQAFHRALHTMHRLLASVCRRPLLPHSVLAECIERVAREVSDHLAHGNLIVFADIAPHFARMYAEFRGATRHDPRAIERFLGKLRPGHVRDGGQDLLIGAFRAYYQAMFEKDPKQKAELILLANDQIGYHEQTRLQHDIERSLNAPIAEIILRAAHERIHQVLPARLQRPVERMVQRVVRPFTRWLQRTWANVATVWLMRLELPGRMLELGKDVDHPDLIDMFPPDLAEIESPELRSLLYELDFTPNTTRGSAAANWGSLRERMNFVVDFFRTHQQDRTLFCPPFTKEQVEVIREGGIPRGDL